MPRTPEPIEDVFAEYERELEERGRAQLAAEDAAWNALPQGERDRINAERTARLEAFGEAAEKAAAVDHGVCTDCGDDLDASEADQGICYDCQNADPAD